MRRRPSSLWLVGLMSLVACHSAQTPDGNGVGAGDDWTSHAAAADESSYSRLDQIKAANVRRLGLAWSLDLPGEASLEGTPLAVAGVLYFTGSYGKVYAVDGVRGNVLWTFDPQTWRRAPAKMRLSFAANRGAAYDNGRIFSASLDGRLFALDARTGQLIWSVATVDPASPQYVTGAPRTFRGRVVIGNGGADFGARGYVTAYDQATGKQLWRFHLAPGAPAENKGDPVMEKAAATWNGEYWKTGTGGGPWDNLTFDPAFNRVYVGAGNAAPYDADKRSPGGGDNLYTASIVALDADTGTYVWHYQVNPRDSWDYDATQQMTLADLTIGGRPRKVLMQAPKNGFFYVLDRSDGKLISAQKFGKVTWADHIDLATGRPVEAQDIRYQHGDAVIWPNPTGAHSWQAMSFDPRTGLVYIPYMQNGVRFSKGAPRKGDVSVGGLSIGSYKTDPMDGRGALLAWDPVRQTQAWRVPHAYIWNGGALSTAGGLVFQGAADGYLTAYDAKSGRQLWRFNAGLGIISPPISWAKDGKQYVSVLVGYGGAAAIGSDVMHVGWKWGAQPRRLLTFALDGQATLPPSPGPDLKVKALDDPKYRIDPAEVAAGHGLYMACAPCHGRDLVAAGAPAPDLRESRIALDPDSFWTVVHDGPLLERGMPKFETFSRRQVTQIYAYVRAGAREALGKGSVEPPAAKETIQAAPM